MKKFIHLILVLPVVLFASCNKNEQKETPEVQQLASPELSISEQTENSFTVSWTTVEGAASYNYTCGWTGDAGNTAETVLSFSGLEAGVEYVLSVSSVPSDASLYSESEPAVVKVTLEEEKEKTYFTIGIQDNKDMRVVTVTIVPDDMDMLYYREAFDDYYFEELGGNAEDVWANALQSYVDVFGSPEIVLSMIATKGNDEFQFEYMYDEHNYILVAGIDSSLNRITPVVDTMIYSGPVPPSDITFEVEYEDVTSSGAVVWVTPSNNDPWSMLLLESRALEGYKDEDLETLLKVTYGEYINDGRVYIGRLDMTYRDGLLTPDTEYTVLVFGWNTTLNTEITKSVFSTLPAASSENITFEWDIEVLGPTDIHVVCTPSDMSAQFIVLPFTLAEYEQYGDDVETYIEDVTGGWITTYDYASMFSVTGISDEYYDWEYISPGTSYKFLAVGVDINNETETVRFYSPQFYEDTVTTPAE